MTTTAWTTSPFGSETVDEIHLADAPLVKVLTQIRFPRLSVLQGDEALGAFASRLGNTYPLLDQQRGIELLVTPDGVSQQKSGQRVWTLKSEDEQWKVTVSETSLSVDTSDYHSRTVFVSRFMDVLTAFTETVRPPFGERLGIRYINRITEQDVVTERLPAFVRKEVLGGLAVKRPTGVTLSHSLSDSMFKVDRHSIQVRCGVLPPGAVLDAELPPTDVASWVLDIDSFTQRRLSMSPAEINTELKTLADHAYRMFRWVVSPEFIRHFGGE